MACRDMQRSRLVKCTYSGMCLPGDPVPQMTIGEMHPTL